MKGEDASATLSALRPEHLEQQCLRLLQRDLQKLDLRALQAVACVACGSPERRYSFEKYGFTLNKCMTCGTLYISPRLSQDVLNRFFRDSEAMSFWARSVYPATVPARRNLAARRVRHLQECLRQLGMCVPARSMLEIGSGFGLFLEQARALHLAERVACIEPSPECCERIRRDGLADEVWESTLDRCHSHDRFDMIVANGVIEHPFSPHAFLGAAAERLTPKGVIVIHSAGSDGLDTNVLRDQAPNVEPPHCQNFISRDGWHHLGARTGMRILRFESLGELDLELICRAASNSADPTFGRFAAFLSQPGLARDVQRLFMRQGCTGFNLVILARNEALPA